MDGIIDVGLFALRGKQAGCRLTLLTFFSTLFNFLYSSVHVSEYHTSANIVVFHLFIKLLLINRTGSKLEQVYKVPCVNIYA